MPKPRLAVYVRDDDEPIPDCPGQTLLFKETP